MRASMIPMGRITANVAIAILAWFWESHEGSTAGAAAIAIAAVAVVMIPALHRDAGHGSHI
ncbi:MAG: hypothetical protein IBJ15_07620 [Alphaproteobacteria bacterium]|nr:hypothetical protein [Alphaproteobacteria bacterium]